MSKTVGTNSSMNVQNLKQPPMHIPDIVDGGSYKSELVIERNVDSTTKILWWHKDDPREEPHNHPWYFESEILSGGYTEERFTLINGIIEKSTKEYREGDINIVPANVYHNVTKILPNTVTKMKCGSLVDGGKWGYLNNDGEFSASTTDPVFLDKLKEMNPHLNK